MCSTGSNVISFVVFFFSKPTTPTGVTQVKEGEHLHTRTVVVVGNIQPIVQQNNFVLNAAHTHTLKSKPPPVNEEHLHISHTATAVVIIISNQVTLTVIIS